MPIIAQGTVSPLSTILNYQIIITCRVLYDTTVVLWQPQTDLRYRHFYVCAGASVCPAGLACVRSRRLFGGCDGCDGMLQMTMAAAKSKSLPFMPQPDALDGSMSGELYNNWSGAIVKRLRNGCE